jgi:sporulation protein YlmC with PRC-barrel domain
MLRIAIRVAKRIAMTRFALLGAGVAVAHVALTNQPASARTTIHGFSAKRHLLGQKVYNDEGQLVGAIEDLILAKRAVSHVIVGVGGFLGIGKHAVAIPVADFTRRDHKILMSHSSEETIRAMPRFEYAQMTE